MDSKKFEQLIDLIINEEEDKAKALFHDIVVEKSREIYESMMDEPVLDEVGTMLDEISAEEEGMVEDEEELADIEVDDGMADEEEVELAPEEDEGADMEDLEDRVVDLEDKLDELMAEFESRLSGEEEAEEEGEEEGEEEAEEEGEEEVMEAVEMKKVPGLYDSKIGGDNGDNAKSPTLTKPKVVQTGAAPVKFSGQQESVPTSPKAGSVKDVEHAGKFKNAPAQGGQKLDKAPAPMKAQASGVNTHSPVAESKKSTKKIVK